MSRIFGKQTLKTLERFGVPLQTYLAYTVNILFKFIWGLRNISKDKQFSGNYESRYDAKMLQVEAECCSKLNWRLLFSTFFFPKFATKFCYVTM